MTGGMLAIVGASTALRCHGRPKSWPSTMAMPFCGDMRGMFTSVLTLYALARQLVPTAAFASMPAAHWDTFRRRKERLTSRPAPEADAAFFIVESTDGSYEICAVEAAAEVAVEGLQGPARRRAQGVRASDLDPRERMVVYRHSRFLFRPEEGRYALLEPEEFGPPPSVERGLSSSEAASRLTLAGRNLIDVPIPPWHVLLLRECVHPFVIFQVWAGELPGGL
jgi:hypothetical protein